MFQWQDTYARQLFPHGYGCALLDPEPNRIGIQTKPDWESVSSEGIRVGDVGVIRDSGNFMSLFNVFRSRDDPVNAIYGVPDGFQPLELFENLYYTAVGSHKPNTRIFSRHTHELKLDASGTALASGMALGPGLDIQFQSSRSEGAILVLPKGADRIDYEGLKAMRAYAKDNAKFWYEFLGSIGMDAYNGSLYLITGYDRTNCYENISFSSSDSSAALISFRFSWPFGDVARLGFSHSSLHDHEYKKGSSRAGHTLHNLTTFIRGFKITLREDLVPGLREQVKVVNINKLKDLKKGSLLSPTNSSPALGSSLSSLRSQSSSSSSQNRSNYSVSPSTSLTSWNSFSSDSESSVNQLSWYHPSNVINDYMLRMVPDALVAITHDQEWSSVLDELDTEIPEDHILISRIMEEFQLHVQRGCVGLEKRSEESLSVSVPSGSDPMAMMVPPSLTISRFTGKQRELSNEGDSEHEQARAAINRLALPQLNWPPRRCANENILAADYSTYSSIYFPNTLAWSGSHRALSSDQLIAFNSGYGPDLLASSGASEVLCSPMPSSNHPGYPRSDHSGVLSTDYSTTSSSGYHSDYLGLDHSSRVTPTNYATTSGSSYLPNYSNWNDFRTEPSANYATTPSSMYSASSHSTAQTAPTKIANVSRSQSKTLRSKGRYVCEICNNSFTAAHNLKNHMNSHGGLRPYSCDKCGESFGTMHVLKRHQSKKHGTQI